MKNLLLKMVIVLLVAAMPMNVDAAAAGGAVASSGAASSDSDSGKSKLSVDDIILIALAFVAFSAIVAVLVVKFPKIKKKLFPDFNPDSMALYRHQLRESIETVKAEVIELKKDAEEELKAAKPGSPEGKQLEQAAQTLDDLKELLKNPKSTLKQTKVLKEALGQLNSPADIIEIVRQARISLKVVLERRFGEADEGVKVEEQLKLFDKVTEKAMSGAIKKVLANSSLKADLIDAYLFNAMTKDDAFLEVWKQEANKSMAHSQAKGFLEKYEADIKAGKNLELVFKEFAGNLAAQDALVEAFGRLDMDKPEYADLQYAIQIKGMLPADNVRVESLAVEAMVAVIKINNKEAVQNLEKLKEIIVKAKKANALDKAFSAVIRASEDHSGKNFEELSSKVKDTSLGLLKTYLDIFIKKGPAPKEVDVAGTKISGHPVAEGHTAGEGGQHGTGDGGDTGGTVTGERFGPDVF